jgi:TRAP-type mannitol/chloroaromatic compound transport system permease small subunit
MKILRLIGGLLIALGALAYLAEILGFPLLIYYGDPVAGIIGLVIIFLGVLLFTIDDLAGTVKGLNLLEIYIKFINTYNEYIGIGVGWFTTLMVVVVFVNVLFRYIGGAGFLQLQDFSWYLFGVVFMIGAAYTLKHDRHVRVDIFYVNYSPRRKVWTNLLGTIFFLIPFCLLGIYVSWGFFQQSFTVQETSPDAGGLAGRYLAKIMIPTGFGLILLQGMALMFTSLLQLQGKWAIEEEGTQEGAH